MLLDYLRAVDEAGQRVARLTADITELSKSWDLAPVAKALQALRGVRLITAATILAELGDLRRFPTPKKLMSFLGMVPAEHSSGAGRHLGRITRTGNGHVRRILTEAAWNYRFRPAINLALRMRQEGVASEVLQIAWKAQHRLYGKYCRLTGRCKNKQQTVIAVARELTGFVWAIGQVAQPLAVA